MVRIGLALGGGAGLGWAHIGVVKVLEAEGVPISAVSGTSIGAIVGACIAGDMLDEIEDVARSLSFKEMLSLGEFGFSKGSLIGAGKIERKLREHFGTRTIEQLQKPFAAIAADLYSGKRIVFDEGDIVTALRASSAVPGVLPPVETDRLLLIDGGVVDPIPVQAVRDLGAEHIIVIDLQGDYMGRAKRLGFDPAFKKPNMAALKTARAGWSLALQALSKANLMSDAPDVIITPAIGHIDMADFTQASSLIAIGMAAAEEAMPAIQVLLEQ